MLILLLDYIMILLVGAYDNNKYSLINYKINNLDLHKGEIFCLIDIYINCGKLYNYGSEFLKYISNNLI